MVLLFRKRVAAGDALASITDYDGKTFSSYHVKAVMIWTSLIPESCWPRMTATLRTHDDSPPPKDNLKMALGDLPSLKKEYLD